MVGISIPTRMGGVKSREEKVSLHGDSLGTQGGMLPFSKPTAQQLADLEVPALACPSQDAWLPSYVERCGSSLISALVARYFSRVSLR
jgi:hypothetical protein